MVIDLQSVVVGSLLDILYLESSCRLMLRTEQSYRSDDHGGQKNNGQDWVKTEKQVSKHIASWKGESNSRLISLLKTDCIEWQMEFQMECMDENKQWIGQ